MYIMGTIIYIKKNDADSSCLNHLVSLESYTEDPAPDI